MFVKAQSVVTALVDEFPGVEILGSGADRDLGFEVLAR